MLNPEKLTLKNSEPKSRIEATRMMLRAKGLPEDEIDEELLWAWDNYRETPPANYKGKGR